MLVVKVSGVKRYKDRHGTPRAYHRISGTPIDVKLTGQALAAEVARLDAIHKPAAPKAGTLGGLLASYQGSPKFLELAPRTKSDYRKIIDFLKPIAPRPLADLGPGFIAKLRDSTLATKRAGFTNHMLAMLSSAFKHGLEYGVVSANPCIGIAPAKMAKNRRKPNRAWTPDERHNVMAAAWPQLRLPLALAMFLGVRRGDIVSMPLQAYKDGWLAFRAGKNDAMLNLPVLGQLKTEIEAAIARRPPKAAALLLCLNTRGKRWTANGLSVQVDKLLKECRGRGLMGPGGSLHGLRHSVGAELRGAGYDKEMRKLILGHDTDEMAEHYSASADVRGQLIDMANVLQMNSRRGRSQ